MVVLKKRMGSTKYIYIYIFKNKIETNVPNINVFGGVHKFCFTNMKIVLQKCTKQAFCFFVFIHFFLLSILIIIIRGGWRI